MVAAEEADYILLAEVDKQTLGLGENLAEEDIAEEGIVVEVGRVAEEGRLRYNLQIGRAHV